MNNFPIIVRYQPCKMPTIQGCIIQKTTRVVRRKAAKKNNIPTSMYRRWKWRHTRSMLLAAGRGSLARKVSSESYVVLLQKTRKHKQERGASEKSHRHFVVVAKRGGKRGPAQRWQIQAVRSQKTDEPPCLARRGILVCRSCPVFAKSRVHDEKEKRKPGDAAGRSRSLSSDKGIITSPWWTVSSASRWQLP